MEQDGPRLLWTGPVLLFIEQFLTKLLTPFSILHHIMIVIIIHEAQLKGDLSIVANLVKHLVVLCPKDQGSSILIGSQRKSWVFFCRYSAVAPKNLQSFISLKNNSELMGRQAAIKISNSCELQEKTSSPNQVNHSCCKRISVLEKEGSNLYDRFRLPIAQISARKVIRHQNKGDACFGHLYRN